MAVPVILNTLSCPQILNYKSIPFWQHKLDIITSSVGLTTFVTPKRFRQSEANSIMF